MERASKIIKQTTPENRVCIVVGAGDGLGGSICKVFASKGYSVVACRRNGHKLKQLESEINSNQNSARCVAVGIDARKEEDVIRLFRDIAAPLGRIEVVVFNIGANVRFEICDTTARVFRKVWEMACLAGFLVGREAASFMKAHGSGSILFTGASASLRGKQGFAAFSSAKSGLRMVAQSMARELGPQGIHVAHVVVDGAIEGKWIRERFPSLSQEQKLNPAHIAEQYWHLHSQPRDCWTFELDVRPHVERW